MDLFSPSDKTDLAGVFNNIADTFGRPITIYKTPTQTVLTTDPNYNFAYNNAGGDTISYTPVSGVFNARIFYDDKQTIDYFTKRDFHSDTLSEARLLMEKGLVRIKVSGDGYNYMKDSTQVVFDNSSFIMFLGRRPHGLFAVDFYDFYLQRIT